MWSWRQAGAQGGVRGHEARSQSAELAGCGLQAVLRQQKLHGLSVRAQARRLMCPVEKNNALGLTKDSRHGLHGVISFRNHQNSGRRIH